MEFLDFVNQFKDVEFVRENLSLDKILKFANSISKADIEKAIAQTKCLDNPYRVYFFSSSSEQKEQWEALMRKL